MRGDARSWSENKYVRTDVTKLHTMCEQRDLHRLQSIQAVEKTIVDDIIGGARTESRMNCAFDMERAEVDRARVPAE